jgi:predicted ATPase
MITHVRARNFKSLKDVDISLGPLNVLVGPNMGGKSNVLDLFRFLYECWSPQFGPGNALTRRQGIDEVLWKGSHDRLLSIAIQFLETARPGREFMYELEIAGGAGGYFTIQKETLTLWTGDKDYQLIVTESGGRWLQNADSGKLVLVQAERSGMELAPPNWDGYPLRLFAQNWRYHQLVPSLMRQANQMTAASVLDPHGSNLSAWLMGLQTRFPDTFARIAEVARDVFPEIRQLLSWPTQQGTVYLASEEQGLLRPIPLFQMSDGELVFIAYLSLIFAPDDLGGTLFFIEEPENHLHPRLFETFISLLRQVQQDSAERGVPPSQIIFTTHSPHVIDQMKLDEILWVEKRQSETNVIRPSDKPHLRKLVEDEELGLGDLMFAGALGRG